MNICPELSPWVSNKAVGTSQWLGKGHSAELQILRLCAFVVKILPSNFRAEYWYYGGVRQSFSFSTTICPRPSLFLYPGIPQNVARQSISDRNR